MLCECGNLITADLSDDQRKPGPPAKSAESWPGKWRNDNMKHSMKSLMVAAAVSGLMSGATALQAATTSSTSPVVQAANASLGSSSMSSHVQKHACKGQNDCKGQGGCKSSDNGCKGKNSCKGKGAALLTAPRCLTNCWRVAFGAGSDAGPFLSTWRTSYASQSL